jgi:hypothetical protein
VKKAFRDALPLLGFLGGDLTIYAATFAVFRAVDQRGSAEFGSYQTARALTTVGGPLVQGGMFVLTTVALARAAEAHHAGIIARSVRTQIPFAAIGLIGCLLAPIELPFLARLFVWLQLLGSSGTAIYSAKLRALGQLNRYTLVRLITLAVFPVLGLVILRSGVTPYLGFVGGSLAVVGAYGVSRSTTWALVRASSFDPKGVRRVTGDLAEVGVIAVPTLFVSRSSLPEAGLLGAVLTAMVLGAILLNGFQARALGRFANGTSTIRPLLLAIPPLGILVGLMYLLGGRIAVKVVSPSATDIGDETIALLALGAAAYLGSLAARPALDAKQPKVVPNVAIAMLAVSLTLLVFTEAKTMEAAMRIVGPTLAMGFAAQYLVLFASQSRGAEQS